METLYHDAAPPCHPERSPVTQCIVLRGEAKDLLDSSAVGLKMTASVYCVMLFVEGNMLADPSTQLMVASGFELNPEDNLTRLKRLIIEPDPDNVGWAHLRTILSDCTLQDLPRPLRRRLSAFVEVLRMCRIRRVLFDLLNPRVLRVDQPQETTRFFRERSPITLQIGLEMTLWWIEYVAHVNLARAREKRSIHKIRTYWRCQECGAEVTSDREWCNKTRDCPSWSMLRACSGLEKGEPLSNIA